MTGKIDCVRGPSRAARVHPGGGGFRRFAATLAAGAALATALGIPSVAGQTAAPAVGQIGQGERLYQEHCALCHGADGRGGQAFPRPIVGAGHDLKKFNTAQGLFEYMQLLMPFDNPQKLDDGQKLAVVAFLLERNAADLGGTALTTANAARIAIK